MGPVRSKSMKERVKEAPECEMRRDKGMDETAEWEMKCVPSRNWHERVKKSSKKETKVARAIVHVLCVGQENGDGLPCR